MAKAKPSRKVVWTILCSATLITGGAIYFFLRQPYPAVASDLPPGRNILVSATTNAIFDEQLLATLSWNDLAATAEGVSNDIALRDKVAAAAAKMQYPPALYLSALLQMAANDLPSALAIFLLIPPAEIPPTHLYAPYRLHNVLRSGPYI